MIFWKRNLLFVWVCQFLAMVGMSAVVPFLPLFVRELGATELKDTAIWSGFVFAGPFFISFFLTPVLGSLGDKYGTKIMTLRAVFGLTIAQIIVGFSQNVTNLFIGRLIQGALWRSFEFPDLWKYDRTNYRGLCRRSCRIETRFHFYRINFHCNCITGFYKVK